MNNIANKELLINCLATSANRVEHFIKKEAQEIQRQLIWYNNDSTIGVPSTP